MNTQGVGAACRRWVFLAGWILAAGLAVGPVMAKHLNNPEGVPATVPTAADIPDRGAPTSKAVFESMVSLLSKQGPPQDWLSFQPPANRALAKTELQLIVQVGTKAKDTADLVEARIGKMQADLVRSMQSGVTPGCELELRNAIGELSHDGKVDWSTVKITEDGDKARVTGADTPSKILLIKVGDKWYLGEGEGSGQDTLAKDVEGNKKMSDSLLKLLDQLQQKVNAGQVNKGNFIQEYQNLVNASLGAG